MKTELAYAIVGALLMFLFVKRKNSTEAREENLKTKEELNKIDGQVEKNKANLDVEKEKQEALKKELKEKLGALLSEKDLEDFFNNRK